MGVLLFAEQSNGELKKAIFEAATYAYDLAQKTGEELVAVSVGQIDNDELSKLGNYGISKVYKIEDKQFDSFINSAYAAAISQVAKELNSKAVVMAQTYYGRAIAPRVAVKLDAAPISGVISLLNPDDQFDATRSSYSGKGIQEFKVQRPNMVLTVKTNGYKTEEHPVQAEIVSKEFQGGQTDYGIVAKEIIRASEGISLTEADAVVSAGRGMKGPENWGMIEELANLIGAATACSKPTADMGWRPHHEHVGQTGIQIAPNLYIAIGISGAIQHLAGVSGSKHIVVINKDPEAPFFKIADYGIVGDLFEVVPKIIEEIKQLKVASS